MYRFDFSLEGVGRRTGHVLMLGTGLEIIDDGLPKPAQAPTEETEPRRSEDGKVVPFRRPKQ
jgi:hypothetical protein